MRVLSWNLYHGRDFPPDPALFTWRSRLLKTAERNATHVQVNRPLLREFANVLDGFHWDVALLREAPPRWFHELCTRTRSHGALVRTSRNWCPPLQRLLAEWNPDLVASFEGGSNQILVRAPGRILDRRARTLTHHPEQRRMQWTRIELRGAGVRREPARLRRLAGASRHRGGARGGACGRLVGGRPARLRRRPEPTAGRDPEPFDVLRDAWGWPRRPRRTRSTTCWCAGSSRASGRRLAPERRELTEPDGLRIRGPRRSAVRSCWRGEIVRGSDHGTGKVCE